MTILDRGGTTLAVSPGSADGTFINSPPSVSPSTRTVITNTVTASGGTGSYAWTRLSGSTEINIDNASAASVYFFATATVDIPLGAVWRVTSGAETVDINVSINYESGL